MCTLTVYPLCVPTLCTLYVYPLCVPLLCTLSVYLGVEGLEGPVGAGRADPDLLEGAGRTDDVI